MQRLPEATKRTISLGNIKINTMVLMTMAIVIQTILMGMIKTNFILKKVNLIFGICLLRELKNGYKTLSMKLYKPQLNTIHTLTQKRQMGSLMIS